MSVEGLLSQQVLMRARLLGADLVDVQTALRGTLAAGQSLAHVVVHPGGRLTHSFTSQKGMPARVSSVSQPEPLRPAFGTQVSRA